MADLYGAAPPSGSEPEEISTFLHQLLHNTSSSSSSFTPFKAKFTQPFSSPPQPPPALTETGPASGLEDRRRFGRSALDCRAGDGNSGAVVDTSSGINFSDPDGYYAKGSAENTFSSVGVVDSDANASSKRRGVSVDNDLGDFSCDSEGPEASEVPLNPVRPRSSSKRSRAAEVHNLSEKRRRSRINEKMKALQNLIPNSNKTDKASMLDEAIEYLKQLQLQVQMLSARNGLSLHPMCLSGVLQHMQLHPTGMGFDEGNGLLSTHSATGTFSSNEENLMQNAFNLSTQCPPISSQPIHIPSATNITASEASFGFEPLTQIHYGPFNLPTSPKEICRESTPQAQLETNHTANNSSGVS